MPTYDYRCTDCGREVEVMHGIDGPGPAACETCGGAMRKALSAPAIHFKGSGWAKKDAQAAATSKTKPATEGLKASSDQKSAAEPAADAKSGKTTDTAKPKDGAKASTSKSSKTV